MIESSFEFTVSSKNKPILIASSHEFYFERKNKFTENRICSKYQIHKCQATAITENSELIETRGEHNYDISAGKPDVRNGRKHLKNLEIYSNCRSCQCGFASYKRFGHSVCPPK